MQLRATCPYRRTGHLRDFIVLIALDVVEDEDSSRSLREAGDRAFQIDGVLDARRARVNVRRTWYVRVRHVSFVIVRQVVSYLMLLTPLLPAGVAQHQIYRQAVDPTRERRLAAPRAEALPDMHEDVLREIAGALTGAAHPQTQRKHA